MPAAELVPRQLWWVTCVLLTGGGIALIAYGRTPGSPCSAACSSSFRT